MFSSRNFLTAAIRASRVPHKLGIQTDYIYIYIYTTAVDTFRVQLNPRHASRNPFTLFFFTLHSFLQHRSHPKAAASSDLHVVRTYV